MTSADPILAIRGLTVSFATEHGSVQAVDDVTFDLDRGEILAVVGESGSGKSVTALSILGLLPDTASLAGRIVLDGEDLAGPCRDTLRRVRGRKIAMVFQDPAAALDPVFSIGAQLDEAITASGSQQHRAARQKRAVELLQLVDIPDAVNRLRDYPHQLSGGQLQRVVIAMALANNPDVLIADEPTTALDVTIQQGILDLLRRLNAEMGTSILLITHDMGVVADIAQRVVVMRAGRVVEIAPVRQLFAAPGHDYSRHLLANIPGRSDPSEVDNPATAEPVLRVEHLHVSYGSRIRGLKHVVAGVSFAIAPGEILGLVGESGSGKTSIGKALLGLASASAAKIQFDGHDLSGRSGRAANALRSRIGAVFQSPSGSLNPRLTIGQSIAEPLEAHTSLGHNDRQRAVEQLLDRVRLPSAWSSRYPHQLSGGQKQRVAIARAIALKPKLLIADEPTSALDVSVQSEILALLDELRRDVAFACLFITHDLNVVRELCSRVLVLHRGQVVEEGRTAAILNDPQQSYTRRLVLSAPVADPVLQEERRRLRQTVVDRSDARGFRPEAKVFAAG